MLGRSRRAGPAARRDYDEGVVAPPGAGVLSGAGVAGAAGGAAGGSAGAEGDAGAGVVVEGAVLPAGGWPSSLLLQALSATASTEARISVLLIM